MSSQHCFHRPVFEATLSWILPLCVLSCCSVLKFSLCNINYVLNVKLPTSEGLLHNGNSFQFVAHALAKSGFDLSDFFLVSERQVVDLMLHWNFVVVIVKPLVCIAKVMGRNMEISRDFVNRNFS